MFVNDVSLNAKTYIYWFFVDFLVCNELKLLKFIDDTALLTDLNEWIVSFGIQEVGLSAIKDEVYAFKSDN